MWLQILTSVFKIHHLRFLRLTIFKETYYQTKKYSYFVQTYVPLNPPMLRKCQHYKNISLIFIHFLIHN